MAIGNPVTLTNNVASKIISVTATANQTLFTVTGGYRINAIAVFRNGVRLVDGSDFTALDASTVTLLSPANLNDTLEFHIFDDFRVADAIVSADANQTISGNLTITGTLTGPSIGIDSGGVNVGAKRRHSTSLELVTHSSKEVTPLMFPSLVVEVVVVSELLSTMLMVQLHHSVSLMHTLRSLRT